MGRKAAQGAAKYSILEGTKYEQENMEVFSIVVVVDDGSSGRDMIHCGIIYWSSVW